MPKETQERREGIINVVLGSTLFLTGASSAFMTGTYEIMRQTIAERSLLFAEMDVDPRTPIFLGVSAVIAAGGYALQEHGHRQLDRLAARQNDIRART